MRTIFILGWLLLPLPVIAYHWGPGQQHLQNEAVDRLLRDAEQAAAEEDWAAAANCYGEALDQLPENATDTARQIRLERAKAQMLSSQLPIAHADLRDLVDELQDDPQRDAKLYQDARAAYANAQYYMTWLMRLEGLSREAWEPEIEAARQTLAALAEEASADGTLEIAENYKEDLEASIKLARMDLSELQGLPLPSQ